jgi:hypothetical protein
MKASRLLGLYPHAWRDRYGDEFLELAGDRPLTLQQVIDIIFGAIDAWLSADVRRAATSGGTMTTKATWLCQGTTTRYTRRDGLIGAAVMIASSLVIVLIGTLLKQAGFDKLAETLFSLGFLVSFTASMPFWLTKGQPWKAQAVITGGTIAFLIVIAIVNAL